MTACGSLIAETFNSLAGPHCGQPATVTVEYGCIHEHVRTETVCVTHAELVTNGSMSQACWDCWPDHDCRLLGRVVVTS